MLNVFCKNVILSHQMTAAYRTQLVLAWIGRLMRLFVSTLRAGTQIRALTVQFSHILVHGVAVFNPVTPAKRAFHYPVALVRLVEVTAATLADVPVTVKIDLTAFDDDLLARNKCLGNLGPGFGINTGQGWPGNIHGL